MIEPEFEIHYKCFKGKSSLEGGENIPLHKCQAGDYNWTLKEYLDDKTNKVNMSARINCSDYLKVKGTEDKMPKCEPKLKHNIA